MRAAKGYRIGKTTLIRILDRKTICLLNIEEEEVNEKVFVVFMLMSTLLVAIGCQQASVTSASTQSSLKQEQGTATIVFQNQEDVTSKEVMFRENESLLKEMQENFAIEEKMALSPQLMASVKIKKPIYFGSILSMTK